jgi:hypothetical protein
LGISALGVWLFLGDREIFLPFEKFPWFRDAPVAGVLNVERPQPHHLYWPDLDIDLHLDSISHPDQYPLVSRGGARGNLRRTVNSKRTVRKKRAPGAGRG